jgi:AraC family transcriptional regulator
MWNCAEPPQVSERPSGCARRSSECEKACRVSERSPVPGSVEQALGAALVDGHAVLRPTVRMYRGGLSPTRLRRVTELVHARIGDDLTLNEMAESAGLSVAHFCQMFRKSTGESPHQFVLRQRVERAREMLRAAEARVLDVAVACGFKTQQHFARVFRRICGASPTEYRQAFLV